MSRYIFVEWVAEASSPPQGMLNNAAHSCVTIVVLKKGLYYVCVWLAKKMGCSSFIEVELKFQLTFG